jgi:hypothetical protein
MPNPKPEKIGRPKLPKGEASDQTVSEWIRGLVASAMGAEA